MSFKDLAILYVEDEDEIRENTKRPLKYLCDNLLIASNGKEGLEKYKQNSVDIVISDIKMPKMNGIEMCKAIKKIDKNQHIIFTTAYSDSSYFIDAIDLQVDGYILKPIDYSLLENKIENIKKQIDTEDQLKKQKILINEIIKFQDNLLVILDKDREIVFSNENFLKFFKVANLKQFKERYGDIDNVMIKESSSFSNYNIEQDNEQNSKKTIVIMVDRSTNKPQTFLSSFRVIKETLHTIIIFTEITNITAEKDKYKYKAFTDELTGLYNRAFFNEVMKKEINLFQREGVSFSLIMFDVDFFKKINDLYGHQVGDDVLKSLSKLVQKYIRESDIFARWGGEEFVIVLPKTSKENAKKVAQNLKEVIENYNFKNNISVTCSFGVSSFGKNDTRDSIIKRADEALYKAKKNGRNKVEVL